MAMHDDISDPAPRSGRVGRTAVLLGGVLAVAALVAGQTHLSMLHHGHAWWRLFVWQAVSWSFWAALVPWLLRRGARWASEGWTRRALPDVLLCLLVAGTHIALSASIVVWLQPYLPVERMGFARAMLYLSTPWAAIDLLLFGSLLAIGAVLAVQRHNRSLALRESRLETELARAQLETLRLKMQPHFLFNTLNSISALVRKGANDRALDMVLGLSTLLRRSLDRSEDQWVTVRDEVDFVRRYVDLHVQRFADRLAYHQTVAPDALDLAVPSFIVQPLVENAIRHGIGQRVEGGTVTLDVTLDVGEQRLVVRVTDDGPGLPQGFALEACTGVGLSSIRTRLLHLYGEDEGRASLSIQPGIAGGTVSVLQLPVALEAATLAEAS